MPNPPGRPTNPAVTARDNTIYNLITQGINSRSALATAANCTRDAAYLSCKRLQKAGRIHQQLGTNGHVIWTTT